MITSNNSEILAAIKEHKSFFECIVEDFKWKHFGTTLELTIRYIYDRDGHIPRSMDDWQVLILRFILVQEVRISNALTPVMCNEPEMLNWGFNEINLVELKDNPDMLKAFGQYALPFHHVVIRFGLERRMDVVFSALEISKHHT